MVANSALVKAREGKNPHIVCIYVSSIGLSEVLTQVQNDPYLTLIKLKFEHVA